ncbi:MAG: hypothetical protein IPH88_17080 [Bacteroidales bacterium]|nr:hypothetical protein [Bacteroidales bacterium]
MAHYLITQPDSMVKFNNKGLPSSPLTTTQRNAIVSPAAGLLIYNTNLNRLEYYGGASIGWTSGSGNGWSLTEMPVQLIQ